ncbi:hypothetical protein PPTG_21234 [Phytophthora nicotianae INRA-310]|uniref:RxLR effector protein n=2 Tax=Phytophthora nicotianae TaxID=4792 RepID=W2R4D3_PHYN3|nr:hypothetical protein PPTG_21234 [Phytophthora nicotianae INRA-310]ETN20121.1 hypothetical protein PPTG_21234 [Phytophthora nicotianae INRA-310]
MATDGGSGCSVLLLALALAVEGKERKNKRQCEPNYLTRFIGDTGAARPRGKQARDLKGRSHRLHHGLRRAKASHPRSNFPLYFPAEYSVP